LRANGEFAEEFKSANGGQPEAKLARGPYRDMVANFLGVLRGDSESSPLNCNVELGCNTMIAIKLGVESYRQKKTMVWDPTREQLLV
jgi:hypothetical protein